jgi:F-box-like
MKRLRVSTIGPKVGPATPAVHRGKSALSAGPGLEAPSEDVDLAIKLPKELITEIFSHCVTETVDLGALGLADCPWNLAQICSSWRAVALSSPNLWNDIAVQLPYHRLGEFVHLRNLLEIFLSRAGNSSISLNITAAVDEYPPDPKLVDSIVSLVRLHIGQFRHLGLQPVGAMMPIL